MHCIHTNNVEIDSNSYRTKRISSAREMSFTVTASKSDCFFAFDAINQESADELKGLIIKYCDEKNSIIIVDAIRKCTFEALDCNVVQITFEWHPGMYSGVRRLIADIRSLVLKVAKLHNSC